MWNEKQIRDMKKNGKIQDFKFSSSGGNKIPVPQPGSAQKEWVELNMLKWCNDHSVSLTKEFYFDKDNEAPQHLLTFRNWRFDFAIRSMKIAVEYEGIFSTVSRHTSIKGFQGDVEKYNKAAVLGWKVLKVTASDYKTILNQLEACIT